MTSNSNNGVGTDEAANTIDIVYEFAFPDGRQDDFQVTLDADTFEPVTSRPGPLPHWTKLDFQQCPNCPLSVDDHPYCPLAANLTLIEPSTAWVSHQEVEVCISTSQRTSIRTTTTQRAIGALMGLLIAVSDCPHALFLRPMARYHLPLATGEETVIRSVSFYLMKQYFVAQAGGNPDWNLEGLIAAYKEIAKVNMHMGKRLRAVSEQDTIINALTELDLFAKNVPFAIEDALEDVKYVFEVTQPTPS